jgi:bis(5'-adenosyl)-triphosphatase
MRFGRFIIPSSHIFYRTQQSAAFVNLRPIVPGHVLVMPHRIVATMDELTDEEYVDLWKSVRVVQRVLKEHYHRTTDTDRTTTTTTSITCSTISAFNVAVQDGRAAGQSVPHVHVHILPRTGGEFERNDDIYDKLEEWAPRDDDLNNQSFSVPDDTDRVDRTNEQMAEEAFAYRQIVESGKKPNDDNNDNAKEGNDCLK